MTASRSQFTKLAVLTVVVAFVVGGILTPPDPVSQFRIVGLLIGAGFVGSYWLVYKSTVDLRPSGGTICSGGTSVRSCLRSV